MRAAGAAYGNRAPTAGASHYGGRMSRPRPKTVAWRAVALAGLASLTAPLLAACGGSDEPESQASA